MALRIQQAVKNQDPKYAESHAELDIEYKKLKNATLEERRRWLSDDMGTPLEEIRLLREQSGFRQRVHVPVPNQFTLSKIYVYVAQQASEVFKKPISPRRVKDCASAWMKFEREFKRGV